MKQLPIMLLLALVLAPIAAVMAQETTNQPTNVPADGQQSVETAEAPTQSIIEAIQEKNWSCVIGAVLMFLVWAIRKYLWKEIPSKYVPWVAVGLGVITDVSLSLATDVVWWKAILSGFTSGAAAIALWELGFKHLLGTNATPVDTGKPA